MQLNFLDQFELEHEVFDYSVRVSSRARRASLKVSAYGRVEVVIPKRYNRDQIAPFVRSHRYWLEHTVARVRSARAAVDVCNEIMPGSIYLRAVSQEWRAEYVQDNNSAWSEAGELRVRIAAETEAEVTHTLHNWLQYQARHHLIPWLERLSRELALPYAGVSVRGQRTLWGSCTARKYISINRNLMFLPAYLVRYLFVHELCHTVHLNHSRKFWARVASIEPEYRHLEAELRRAECYVPLWAGQR